MSQREGGLKEAVVRAERTGTDAQLANALDQLAMYLHEQGRYEEAAPVYGRALGLWRQILGPAHPSIGTLLVNLGAIYLHLGDLTAAEPVFRQALNIFENDPDFEDPGAVEHCDNFVEAIRRTGRDDEASRLGLRVRKISERVQQTVSVRS
jgi:tetratricopeptide (TPR) repeat protein